jgi:hypothetical protein
MGSILWQIENLAGSRASEGGVVYYLLTYTYEAITF